MKLTHRFMDRRVPKGTKAIPVRKANVDYKASGVRRESAVHRVSEVCKDPQERKGIKVIQVRKDRWDRKEKKATQAPTVLPVRKDPQEQKGIKVIQVRKDRRDRSLHRPDRDL